MSLAGDVPNSIVNYSHTRCLDSDRLRCHSTSQSHNLQKDNYTKGSADEIPSSFTYYFDQQLEEIEENSKKAFPSSSSSSTSSSSSSSGPPPGKCDRKCCKVGRNSGRFRSFVRAKMNFIDVSRIRPATSTKMCMKTRLVGDDCKPLLIRGSDELMFPINDDIANDHMVCKIKLKQISLSQSFLKTITNICLDDDQVPDAMEVAADDFSTDLPGPFVCRF